MYPVCEENKSFPKEKETILVDYLDKLPEDTRLINVDKELRKVWKKLQLKVSGAEFSAAMSEIAKEHYTLTRNFEFVLDGQRSPTIGLLRSMNRFLVDYGLRIDLKKLLNNARVKFGHGGNAASAQLPYSLTPQLAYLVGALRDGTLARCGKYEISISQNNDRWLKILKNIINCVFDPSNEPAIRNSRVTLSNRPIFEYLHRVFEIPVGKKDNWETPMIIKKASPSLQRYYIRGFYDADGLSYKLGFCQVNKEAIVFVKETLEKLGIKTGKLSIVDKPERKTMYYISTSRESHARFIKIIGSLNPSKQKLFLPHNITS